MTQQRNNLWRFALSLAIGWFGTILPMMMAGLVQNLSWGLRALPDWILPDWCVHGSFAVLLMLWIAMILHLLLKLWQRKPSRVTYGHSDQRLATPRPLPIKPKSITTPMATTNNPLKDETPPNEASAQQ